MMAQSEQREIEFMIAVNTKTIPKDDLGRLAIQVEHEWDFKYAIDFDARRLFGPLDGTVDGDLVFAPSGHVVAPGGIDDMSELQAAAQRRIEAMTLAEDPPQLDESLFAGCRMTKYGWVLEAAFTAWVDSSRSNHWNLDRACAVYEAGSGRTIDLAVKERLLMAELQLIVRHPLVPQPK